MPPWGASAADLVLSGVRIAAGTDPSHPVRSGSRPDTGAPTAPRAVAVDGHGTYPEDVVSPSKG